MTACTEKEAAEKWCPHMRKALVDTQWGMVAGNMNVRSDFAPCTCIGSRCMQWRWFDGTEQRLDLDQRPPGDGWVNQGHSPFSPKGYSRWHRELTDDMRRGYCGLAGKP